MYLFLFFRPIFFSKLQQVWGQLFSQREPFFEVNRTCLQNMRSISNVLSFHFTELHQLLWMRKVGRENFIKTHDQVNSQKLFKNELIPMA